MVAVIVICIIMVSFFAVIFGVPQMIAYMYAARQFRRVLEAWYHRTNPDDPMPVFSYNKGQDDGEEGDSDAH